MPYSIIIYWVDMNNMVLIPGTLHLLLDSVLFSFIKRQKKLYISVLNFLFFLDGRQMKRERTSR